MEADPSISVLVLFRHPLFGEGVAHLLRHQPDLAVTAMAIDGAGPPSAVMDPAPDVVIVERGDPGRAVEVLRVAPDALVIDVGMEPGPAYAYRRDVLESCPDGLVGLIHEVLGRRRPGVAVMQMPVVVTAPAGRI